MNLNINEISAGRHYAQRVSGSASAAEREISKQSTEPKQMMDSVSTSSLARMASNVLRQMREESAVAFRQEKVEQFKFLATDGGNGGSVPAADEMADSIFSRMFG